MSKRSKNHSKSGDSAANPGTGLAEVVETTTPAPAGVLLEQILETELGASNGEPVEQKDPVAELLGELAGNEPAALPEPVTASEPEPPAAEPAAAETTAPKRRGRKAAVEPKPEKAPRMTRYNASRADRALHKMGEAANDTLLLVNSDALLEGAELQARQKEILSRLNDCTQIKVAEKALLLLGWLAKGGNLNPTVKVGLETIIKDNGVTSGEDGNLFKALIAAGLVPTTARSRVGQIMCMFPMLEIASRDGKNGLVPNPESVILTKARAELAA